MKRSPSLLIALLATAFTLPAFAGSLPTRSTYTPKKVEAPLIISAPERLNPVSKSAVRDGFEVTGGEAGWQLSQHRFVLKDGKFVHGDECDHVIRSASAVSPADIERGRVQSPGS